MDNKNGNIKKSLLSGLFWVLLANLLVKPFWILGIEVGVQNAVGEKMYGFYYAILSLTYIINIVLDLGITNCNTRNIAQNPKLIAKHLSGLLSIKLLLFVLYLVVAFSIGAMLGYNSRQFHLLAWLCLNQFLNSLILYLRSNFEGLLLFKWDSLLSVLDRILMIVICALLLWCPMGQGTFRIEWFVGAQTVAYIVTALLALVVLAQRVGLHRLKWNAPFTLAILKKSIPFALLVLLMASYNRIDPVMLQQFSPSGDGDHNVGIYAGAFRLLDALTMIAYLVSVPLLPVYSKLTKNSAGGDNTELTGITRMVFSMMMVFAITASCLLSALSDPTMDLLYDAHTGEYSDVFRVLIFCIIPISVTYVFGTLLTAAGKLKQLNLFAAGSLLLNMIVNLYCIPRWGAVGSAFAALGAQSLMAVAQVVAAVKLFRMRISVGYILKLSLFTLSIVAMTVCSSHWQWWLTLSVVAVLAAGMAFLLKLIDVREIIKELKNNK